MGLWADQISWLEPEQIRALNDSQLRALRPHLIRALKPEQIASLTEYQIQALKEYQIKALVIHILGESYNESDKRLEEFQAKLRAYGVLGKIQEQDIKKAFSAIHFVAKGKNFTSEHLATLKSSRTWNEFIQKLVTDFLTLFRTEKQESMGEAKGNFQSFIKQQQECMGAAARAA